MRRHAKIILAAMLAVLLTAGELAGQEKQKEEKAKIEKEISLLNQEIARNEKARGSAINRLNLQKKQIKNRQELIRLSDREIARLSGDISRKQQDILSLRLRLDTLEAGYARLVRCCYRNRDNKVWYMYLLSSEDPSQAYHRYAYLKSFSTSLKREALRIRQTRSELESQQQRLRQLKDDEDRLRGRRELELSALEKEKKASEKTLATLKKDKKKYQRELAQKKKEAERLEQEIRAIIKKSMGGKKGVTTKMTAVDVALSKEFAANKKKLPWPVEGSVVPQVHGNLRSDRYNIHIATQPSAPVQAIFNGTVLQVAILPGYNLCVLIRHGEYVSLYCKLASASVRAGDSVHTGQNIGKVSTIGGENQLLFALRKGEKDQLNPLDWLK